MSNGDETISVQAVCWGLNWKRNDNNCEQNSDVAAAFRTTIDTRSVNGVGAMDGLMAGQVH